VSPGSDRGAGERSRLDHSLARGGAPSPARCLEIPKPGAQAVELHLEQPSMVSRRIVTSQLLAGQCENRDGPAQLVLGTRDQLQPVPEHQQRGERQRPPEGRRHSASVSL
jgi:hypothetical protein